MRKYIASLVIGSLLIIIGGAIYFWGRSSSSNIDATSKKEIEDAVAKLESYEDAYAITNLMEAPDGILSYIEVVSGDNNYTEYPMDSEGNVGVEGENTTYFLSDWMVDGGSYYILGSDDDNNLLSYTLPSSYQELCSDRTNLYVDMMIDDFISITKIGTQEVDLGSGYENLVLYQCILPSETVREILGMGNYGLYDSIRKDYKNNSAIVSLCDYYCSELDMNLTFSDANIMIGISEDEGLLRYMSLETGGLGTRLYLTKIVVLDGISVRSLPDFSGATDYVDTMQDLADYCAEFNSVEEALSGTGLVEEIQE